MKKILVTGGSGFIGSYVIEKLLSHGISAVVFERRLRPSYRENVGVFIGDVRDAEAVMDAVGSCDGVIHLAGMLGTQETMETPKEAIDVNILGTLNVLYACRLHAKKSVMISAGNYWMNNPYAITKSAAERFSSMYRKEFDMQIGIIRAFNVYGPGQRVAPVRKVVPSFVQQALAGKDLTVYGSGNQIMDMIYVEDVAKIIVRSLIEHQGDNETIVEAGMGRDTTINELAALIIKLSKSESRINHVDMRPGESPESVVKADVETLKTLGFSPKDLTPLEEGLSRTIKWYRDQHDLTGRKLNDSRNILIAAG